MSSAFRHAKLVALVWNVAAPEMGFSGSCCGFLLAPTLLQDGMLNSTPQHGCIWTKVFLAWKVFLASAQGQYMLKNGFFQP
jgi:hypothetical protein